MADRALTGTITKKPGESWNVSINFTGSNGIPASATVTAINPSTGAAASVIQSGAGVISGLFVSFGVTGGTVWTKYLITVTTTLGDGSIWIDDFDLLIVA